MAVWETPLVIALIFLSLTSALISISDDSFEKILTETNTTITEKLGYGSLYAITLNNLVPSYRYELPSTNEKYVVGINDIPFFDGTDLILGLPLFLIGFFFIKKSWLRNPTFWHRFELILFLILFIITLFLIVKFVYYQIYLYSGQQIGITVEEAIQTRETFLSKTEKSSMLLFIVSILGGFAIYNNLFGKKKK